LSIDGKNIIVILLAGGVGSRFKSKTNKQLIKINGKTILEKCIENYQNILTNFNIQIVSNKENLITVKGISQKYKLFDPVKGGKTRQESVFLGLEAIKEKLPEYVLIHDAARPIVSNNVLRSLFDFIKKKAVCVAPIIPINDAMRLMKNNQIEKILPKKDHVLVQTPQLCNYNELLLAHNQNSDVIYDDETSILFNMGKIINTVQGDPISLKITYENDFKILEPHLIDKKNNYITKIGLGFDIHRFDTKKSDDHKNFITLGGIRISNIKSLIGHSDADVLLHAITDSILGVINVGDIGLLFPPSDEKWMNQDSSYFLKHAKMLLDKSNGKINNIDAVVICEKPKILDYCKQMQEKISHILKINPKRISIKGKTSESIGFIGREEGIAVMANTSIQIIENIYDD
jgi:2-C-methyl-D-erythritol 4-phosphate cytidylyltransferase/2-C-methyl-D-erythritol 2,4-cyclodiphosphate synthase